MLGEFDLEMEIANEEGEALPKQMETDPISVRTFLSSLTNVRDGIVVRITDGPAYLGVDHTDAAAGAILLYLYENAADNTVAQTEVTLISNLLAKLAEAAEAAKTDDKKDYLVADLLTDEVRTILSAWWWLTYLTAARHYDPKFDADAKNWEDVPTEPNPNIRIYAKEKTLGQEGE